MKLNNRDLVLRGFLRILPTHLERYLRAALGERCTPEVLRPLLTGDGPVPEFPDLANLPGEIETLEAEIAADQARMNEPDFFRQPPEQIKDFQTALADKEQKVLDMMARWEDLLEKEAQVNASRGR